MIRVAVLMSAFLFAAPAAFAHDDVNIIYPPERPAHHAQKPKAAHPVIIVKTKTVVRVNVRLGETRAERRKRALFQTWTGFHKVYSGPQYPF